mmetsp:Transcript_95440/g.275555  ORF Transcript_95440/g.275555 Transcript_95440/m.275555 type:complete len:437 (-) Transcript_95440:67-1377(-)|eukprot:CAMPEP_0176093190 /NCGR_PEP_ID=MMETSP0120_2-20121206/46693_1 /TAXON_ID=160619 /ORGANISM="Kryptoperidinium foliaceum, Strain CCMP 1326" /LENGTH=436 /DNA_ID=CAMNT_0017427119 /DNA_START=46 /DNA_END=1356 /DNA_ORIENTATION=+
MVNMLVALFCSLVAAAFAEEHWAVLVAGSKDWWNYRHQADVCHAYQVLIARGFHPERIITMLYDDVAHSRMNPFPGQLFNYPWERAWEAFDVYEGCNVDYRGCQVTSERFLAVLRGDADAAGGRVLQSGADDHVFINFVDHGDLGIISFPQDDDVLHAKDLIDTLVSMHTKGMYKQLVFYLETCNSGSIFAGLLPSDLPVYAVTASNSTEPSWAAFCGSVARVGGRPLDTCLGDLFSVSWMFDADMQRCNRSETLDHQFEVAKNLTNKSHVVRFGEVGAIAPDLVSEFEGVVGELCRPPPLSALVQASASAVIARDVKLEHLERRAEAGDEEAAGELHRELAARAEASALASALLRSNSGAALGARLPETFSWTPDLAACHSRAVSAFGKLCGWRESRLPLATTLYHLCVASDADFGPVLSALHGACSERPAAVLV